MPRLKTAKVEQAIDAITKSTVQKYTTYWTEIAPTTAAEKLQRWYFALLSPRTNWAVNCQLYRVVINSDWTSADELAGILRLAGGGLYNNRARFLETIRRQAAPPGRVLMTPEEAGWTLGWQSWRDRLAKSVIVGAGQKVVSFALELCFPTASQVITIDSHMKKLYGLKPDANMSEGQYRKLESHWVETCRQKRYPPTMVRHIIWDQQHDRPNETSRYWSKVFETPGRAYGTHARRKRSVVARA